LPQSLSTDTVAHIVQVALTPVFLLTAIASLLNVFAQRLARVADRVERLKEASAGREAELARLRLRSRTLDGAVVLGALAGLATCGATLTLFLGALSGNARRELLFGLFAAALGCAMLSLCAFAVETLLSSYAVRSASKAEAAPSRTGEMGGTGG